MEIRNFSNLKIIVIGDVMLDEFIYGQSTRLSPEYPVPIIEVNEKIQILGGAANVAANLVGLGAKVYLFSVLGEDEAQKIILNQLENIGCHTNYCIGSHERKTTIKSRYFSNSTPVMRLDHEDFHAIPHEISKKLLLGLQKTIDEKKIDAIILQDYNKGVLESPLIKKIIKISQEKGIPSFVDPKLNNYDSFKNCTFFKPNLKEMSTILEVEPEEIVGSLTVYTSKLKEYVGYDKLILTLSEKGAYFRCNETEELVSVDPIENADVSGAGDSFISAFCLNYCTSLDIKESIKFANYVSGIACQNKAVYAVQKNDIKLS